MFEGARQSYERRLRALEALGHRGSTSAKEEEAAKLIASELEAAGVPATIEEFQGHDALGPQILIHVIASGLALALAWTAPILTAVLGALSLFSFIEEASSRRMLLSRLLPRRVSRNVVGRVGPREPAGRVVVCAHFDTQRTGLLWHDRVQRTMAPLLASSPGILKSPLLLVLIGIVLVPVLGGVRLLAPSLGAVEPVASALFVVFGIAGAVLAQWSTGPYVPGANDNASGVAAAIALAEGWKRAPAQGVEVVALLTGCEETGTRGAAAWIEAHKAEIDAVPTWFLVIDSVGYGKPRFVGREHSLAAVPAPYAERPVALCREAAQHLGLEAAGPITLPVVTDAIAFLSRGIQGGTVLACLDDGTMPNYHQLTDTSDRMSFEVAWQSTLFAEEVLRRFAAQWSRESRTDEPAARARAG